MSHRRPLPPIDPATLHARRERVFLLLSGLFLGTLAMLNILGISRFLVFASWTPEGWLWGEAATGPEAWMFAIAVGVLPYPITFLCTDLISELFGRKRANTVVLVGLLLNGWVIFILWLGTTLPGAPPVQPETGMPPVPEWNAQKQMFDETGWTFFQLKRLAFGAVAASMIAYLAAQFCDVYLFHFWKRLTRGRHLWLRNNGSTLVSQLVDTSAVILITHFYANALPVSDERALWPQLLTFILTGYAFKFAVALIDTAPIYLVVPALGRYLRIDPEGEHAADQEEIRLYTQREAAAVQGRDRSSATAPTSRE